LHHLDCVLGHAAAVLSRPFPVSIGNLRYHLTALFNRFENCSDIEVPIKGTFDSDFNIVKVYEYSDL
jgi:hypothetical protein